MGIFIATKLSSKRKNFAFHFWKYFERILDSNVIIHSKISRANVSNREKSCQADIARKANPKISQAKIGLDFSAKFIRPISRQCVCNIIQQHSFGRHSQGLRLVKGHGFERHG